MRAKEFLKRYERANEIAQRCKAEYEAEEAQIDSIRSSADLDGMPHSRSVSRKTEEKALRLAEKKQKWIDAELDALEERQRVFDVIHNIPGVEGDILIQRYVNLHKWEEVCVIVSYSWSQTHELHKQALKIVQNRIESDT